MYASLTFSNFDNPVKDVWLHYTATHPKQRLLKLFLWLPYLLFSHLLGANVLSSTLDEQQIANATERTWNALDPEYLPQKGILSSIKCTT